MLKGIGSFFERLADYNVVSAAMVAIGMGCVLFAEIGLLVRRSKETVHQVLTALNPLSLVAVYIYIEMFLASGGPDVGSEIGLWYGPFTLYIFYGAVNLWIAFKSRGLEQEKQS